jgi:hypothetical protein
MTSEIAFSDSSADDHWLGLGSSAGRIEFDDQTTDEINILSANVGIGTATPGYTLDVQGTGNFTGDTKVTSSTASSSASTGALIVTGGAGIGGAVNVGGSANITGDTTVSSSTASTSTTTGALKVTGGVGIGGAANIGGDTTVTSSTASSTASTGALVVAGGAGIGGAVNVGGSANITGDTTVNSLTASSSTTTGALKVSGGVGIAGKVNIGNDTTVTGAFAATSSIASNALYVKESGASPTYYTGFIGGDQTQDVNYTLPATYPAANGYVLSSTTAGTMSWVSTSDPNADTPYIANGKAEVSDSGWSIYNDTTSVPADGTGGTLDSDFNWTRSTSLPIKGTGHFKLEKNQTASLVGHGVSYDFSVARADLGKPLEISFDYDTDSGYTADDINVYLYEVGASIIIPITKSLAEGTNNEVKRFKTVVAGPASSSCRLLFHIANNGAAATWNAYFDNITVAPATKYGCRYSSNASQSIPSGSVTIIDFEDRVYDPGNEVAPGASWKWTAKRAGRVSVSAAVGQSFTSSVKPRLKLGIYVSNIVHSETMQTGVDTTTSKFYGCHIAGEVVVNVGDYIDIRYYQDSGSSRVLGNDSESNWVNISYVD